MVVDDEQDTQTLFEQRFRREIKAALVDLIFFFSAETALFYLQSPQAATPELILSDINMPGLGGLELLRRVKALYQDLPVIMVTAYSNNQNYQIAMENGADDYISKPIDFRALKAKVLEE
ncbi:response regulator [filamentous cyanobacterium CCP5]|nr:response regulator [filamentous cyanobacterium CCP5]